MANINEVLEAPKRVRMFAGPNGSGKTSLVEKLSREYSLDGLFQLYQFINADEIHQALIARAPISLDFLEQSVNTDQLRAKLIAAGRLLREHPFIASVQIVDGQLIAPTSSVDGYVAAAVADFLREELLATGR